MKGQLTVEIDVEDLNPICGSEIVAKLGKKGVDRVEFGMARATQKKIRLNMCCLGTFGYSGPKYKWIERQPNMVVTLRP